MNPELEELAARYILDRLDPGERADFETRLAGSPELAALVRDLETALAREVRSLPQHQPPADLLARIESRLERVDAVKAATARSRKSRPGWAAIARWGLAAVITVSVATLAVQSLRRPAQPAPVVLIVGLGSHASTPSELPLSVAPGSAESFVQLAMLAEKFWDDPEKLPVARAASGPSAHGYALFDPRSNQGFIAVRQLPTPAPGQHYCLWVVDTASGRVSAAGALPANGVNSGLYSFNTPAPDKAVSSQLSFFVTAEDASAANPSRPQGKVVLGKKEI